ncbi:phosphoribosyltransferase [Flavobacterium sp. ZT3R18]|uniref:phosphoribosyltransferase n=1 Tax=Flavobacterium sp. ZT3R18 TaxID=2594429 RepID=UPI00117B85C1|nr:phosphoribosyltransferase family protein [Flavobacterium sp. ZT3R18]TRX36599.1 phosphoribosyltransferase [Flavobacterium sp. ZT3R18]
MYKNKLKDRKEAGILLSEKLKKNQDGNSIVLAIPRGGVPVGYEIAQKLHLPLDIILSKKIGHPMNKEFAIGAMTIDTTIIDEHPGIPEQYITDEIIRLKKLLREKHQLYMGNREPLAVKGKNVIVVDDGIATGNTLLACISMLRKRKPAKIIVAVPVLPLDVLEIFKQQTDEFVYLITSSNFRSVGAFYDQFYQVEDDEVIQMLRIINPIA